MKLHANAALSWSGRRLLASGWWLRVDAEGGGRGCGGQRALCAQVGGPVSARGRAGAVGSLVGAAAGRQPHAGRAGGGDRGAAAAAHDGGRDRGDVGDGALDGLRGSSPGVGWVGSAGSVSSTPCATSARVRASSSTSTSRSSAGSRVAPASAPRGRAQALHSRALTDPAGRRRGTTSAGSSSTSPSTTTAASPTPRCSPTSAHDTAIGFLRRALAFFARHGIQVERILTDNGSAYISALHALACRTPRHPPPPHPATTDRRPTAKPSASSAPSSPAGPTAPSTAPAANAPPPLTAGSGTTTIDDDTQPSATNPRSAEPTCSGPTARRAWRNAPVPPWPRCSPPMRRPPSARSLDYEHSLQPCLGTTIAPRRRATFRRTLLEGSRAAPRRPLSGWSGLPPSLALPPLPSPSLP